MPSPCKPASGWVLAAMTWAMPVHAQGVAGIVIDPQDRRVAGAPVELVCADQRWRTISDGEGRFAFGREIGGEPCTLRVTVPGFASAAVRLDGGTAKPQLVRLAIEAVAETVEVRAAAAGAGAGSPLTGEQARAISDNPADILRFAKARAGPATGYAVYVDGLPAEQLPPVSRMASVTVNGDPFSAEYSDAGRQRIEITTSAPDRHWRVDLSGGPQTIGGANPLGERSSSHSLAAGVAGPSPWAGGAFSIHAGRDVLEYDRAVVAATRDASMTAARIVPSTTDRQVVSFQFNQSLPAAGTLRVDGTRAVVRTSNAGVGGEVLPEAGHSSDGSTAELRALVRYDGRGVSWRNQFLADWGAYSTRATSAAMGVQVPGAFVLGGAALASSTTDRTRVFVKSVIESPSGAFPWRVGFTAGRAFHQSAQIPNDAGSFQAASADVQRAVVDGEPIGTSFRFVGPTLQHVSLTEAAMFADATILQRSHVRLAAGARADWQSRDRLRFSPRLSLLGQAGAWTFSGGVGWFTETWRPEVFLGTRSAEGHAPLQMMSREVSLAGAVGGSATGEPIAMDVAPGLTRPRYLMMSQGAERPVGRFTAGVEHVWWRGRLLLGAERLPDQAVSGWTDWLESNRSIDSHELRFRVGIGGRGRSASATYAWTHSVDDTDGPWSFPARQGALAAENARSARVAAHSLDFVASASVPLGVRLTAMASLRGGSPYDIVSGLDAEANGLYTDRGGLPRNSGRLPGSRSVALYLSRRFNLASLVGPRVDLPIDGGVQFDNIFGARAWTVVGNVSGSPLFGRPEGAMSSRSVRFWFALAR
jgi:hypothetical protein